MCSCSLAPRLQACHASPSSLKTVMASNRPPMSTLHLTFLTQPRSQIGPANTSPSAAKPPTVSRLPERKSPKSGSWPPKAVPSPEGSLPHTAPAGLWWPRAVSSSSFTCCALCWVARSLASFKSDSGRFPRVAFSAHPTTPPVSLLIFLQGTCHHLTHDVF